MKKYIGISLLLLLLTPLFFYKLGQSSLVSWDEGWYAGIARHIVESGNFMQLFWNGKPFFDHPVAGFWWMALSFKIFGFTNFAARLPSAVFGFGTLIVTYLLGKELFNRWVGIASSLALASAPWFLYRSRTGDLDVYLTFFFVLSILLAFKSVKSQKFFIPLGISLALLFLTKTMVPVTILPSLVIIFLGRKINWKGIGKTFVIFIAIVGIWVYYQLKFNLDFLARYFYIGLPGINTNTSYISNFKAALNYVHQGLGRWLWPSVFSIFANFIWRKKSFVVLSVFSASFFIPFIFSNRGQIWHYIPVYPFLLLSLFAFLFNIFKVISRNNTRAAFTVMFICLIIAIPQIKSNWIQFIDIPRYISDEEILSREAGKYPDPLYVDSDFVQTAIFYSGKSVVKQTNVGGIADIFKNEKHFLLITTLNRLGDEKILPKLYEVLKSDRDKVLVWKK